MVDVLRRWIAAMALAMLLPAVALAAPPQVVSQGPLIAPGVDRFVLHSSRVGRDFVVEVTPPKAVANAGKAPAIYALDGGYGVAGPIGQMLVAVGAMRPAFVVTIGYVANAATTRLSDLLYDQGPIDGKPAGGGGAAFQGFLLEELRPFIEARYRVDPGQSLLFGHSLGGLFAANLIARQPQAFNSYLIASPSVWADPTIITRVANVTAAGAGQRRIYLAVGGAEGPVMVDGAQRLALVLQPNFLVKTEVFAGGTHMSYYPLATAAALPWLLPPLPTPAP